VEQRAGPERPAAQRQERVVMSALRAPAGTATRLRVRPWHADGRVAHISPAGDGRGPITPDDVRACLERIRHWGYRAAVTAALGRADRWAFVDAGFAPAERLHLLLHSLDRLPDQPVTPGVQIRRGRRRDLDAVLAVDGRAFTGMWKLDRAGIDEALTATPAVHLRVARHGAAMVGYCVCDRASQRGYVQRLAVHPRTQGRGVGGALLADGLRWLRRWGARDALVNTQEGNDRSLRLYQRAGFVLQPDGLTVMRIALGDDGDGAYGVAR
jgi:ribosomal protein S18 acetylase RimI-like enzyme